jgi:putative polyhydroxyalkanoate system protein
MAIIELHRAHALGRARAREATLALAEQLERELQIEYYWEDDELRFHRPGADGFVRVSDSEIVVRVTLGWMLAPLRARIERHIADHLETKLA